MNVILYFQPKTRTSTPGKFIGVQEIAEKAGYHVQVLDALPTRAEFRSLLGFWSPVGAIVECGGDYSDIDVRLFAGIPTVFFNHSPETLPRGAFAVFHDQAATAELAAKELLLTGYGNFAFVPSFEKRFWSDAREAGFRRALALNGQTCRVLSFGGARAPTARQKRLCAFLVALPKPCAVFAANDGMATETATAAAFVGLRIPEDLAILGIDNYQPVCEKARPPLTSIEPDFRRGGNLAALMLLARVRAKGGYRGPHTRTFGPLRVVRRASTRVFFRQDKTVAAALDLIRNEACNGLRARDVAALFPCSRRFADLRFRQATGHSILEEIQAVRLERAQDLLRDPQQQIKAISNFCGFANPNSLRKFFRAATGQTMSAWRAAESASMPQRRRLT